MVSYKYCKDYSELTEDNDQEPRGNDQHPPAKMPLIHGGYGGLE